MTRSLSFIITLLLFLPQLQADVIARLIKVEGNVYFKRMGMETFSEKEKLSLLSAFMILDLKRLLVGNKPLNAKKAWLIFVISSLIIGFVCYFLVVACEWLGSDRFSVPWVCEFEVLGVPLLFVAIILAAIGSSVPDSIINQKIKEIISY